MCDNTDGIPICQGICSLQTFRVFHTATFLLCQHTQTQKHTCLDFGKLKKEKKQSDYTMTTLQEELQEL